MSKRPRRSKKYPKTDEYPAELCGVLEFSYIDEDTSETLTYNGYASSVEIMPSGLHLIWRGHNLISSHDNDHVLEWSWTDQPRSIDQLSALSRMLGVRALRTLGTS